ncbi:hypothetical protein EZH24_00425 [Brachyspira catarrhinii]|uniref:Uncharacterized protein n=1 Tax=Brachyspira catarrhinii TaxID=2528966 RepID=A0ABY2TU34_9SPIR|nr:hypothetical protein EZH24_00425 [Brachyspira catarrhinii]
MSMASTSVFCIYGVHTDWINFLNF